MIAVTPSQFDKAASAVNKDEFLDLGQHCASSTCNQLDFLPFKCPACLKSFCQDHWKPETGHACDKYDPIKFDNRIPSCPICHDPVPFKVGTDPNIAMDEHLSRTCRTLHPEAAKTARQGTMPVCGERKCNKKLVAPIKCPDCQVSFCASHRYGKDHDCPGKSSTSANKSKTGGFGLNSGSSAQATNNGLAALRKAQQALKNGAGHVTSAATTTSKQQTTSTTTTAPAFDIRNVSSSVKSGRRAAQERDSARKALEMRAKKGLLTEHEKVRYATLAALSAKEKDKKACIIS